MSAKALQDLRRPLAVTIITDENRELAGAAGRRAAAYGWCIFDSLCCAIVGVTISKKDPEVGGGHHIHRRNSPFTFLQVDCGLHNHMVALVMDHSRCVLILELSTVLVIHDFEICTG